jgi:hypothetical protein
MASTAGIGASAAPTGTVTIVVIEALFDARQDKRGHGDPS